MFVYRIGGLDVIFYFQLNGNTNSARKEGKRDTHSFTFSCTSYRQALGVPALYTVHAAIGIYRGVAALHLPYYTSYDRLMKRSSPFCWKNDDFGSSETLSDVRMSGALPSCLLQHAVDCLHPARVQSHSLPCRERQQDQLSAWAQSLLIHGRTGSVHICGSPGVGKTATLTAVTAGLREWAAQRGCMELCTGNVPTSASSTLGCESPAPCAVRAYAVHYINAMTLDSDPGSVFSHLQARMKAAESLLGPLAEAPAVGGKAKAGQKRKASAQSISAYSSAMPGYTEVESFLDARGDNAKGAQMLVNGVSSTHLQAVATALSVQIDPLHQVVGGALSSPTPPSAAGHGGPPANSTSREEEDDDIIELVPPPPVRERKKSRMDAELEKQKLAMAKYMRKPTAAAPDLRHVKEQRSSGKLDSSMPVPYVPSFQSSSASAHGPAVANLSSPALLTPPSAVFSDEASGGTPASSCTVGAHADTVSQASSSLCTGPSPLAQSAHTGVSSGPLEREVIMANSQYESAHKGAILGRTEDGQVQAVLHILVIDETDALLGSAGRMGAGGLGSSITAATQSLGGASKAAEALYKLFAWPHVPGSNVALISIANAIDMTEKHLPRLSTLGIRPSVLVFSTYTATELEAIAMDRLNRACVGYLQKIQEAHKEAGSDGKSPIRAGGGASEAGGWWPALVSSVPGLKEAVQRLQWVISPEAVSMVCKKVASKDGDARKVLYLLRRALQSACERLCTPPAPILPVSSSAGETSPGDEEEDEDMRLLQGDTGPSGSLQPGDAAMEEDATLSALLAEIVGAAPTQAARSSTTLPTQTEDRAGSSSYAAEQHHASTEAVVPGTAIEDTTVQVQACDCCKTGFAWVKPAPHVHVQAAQTGLTTAGAGTGSGKPAARPAGRAAAPPPPYAVNLMDVSSLLRSAYEAVTVRSLMSLPRQAQVLICAIRAVSEREAAKKAREAQYGEFVNQKEMPLLWATAEGVHQESLNAIDRAVSAVQAESVESAMAKAVHSPISAELVRLAYAKMCKIHCLAEVSARAELKELLEVLRANGLVLVLQKGTGLGKGAASAGGRATRVQGSVNQGKQINWLAATSVQLNVPVAEIDLAFGELSFYKRIAASIRTGEV